ncbi:MAG: TIGR01244 family sulfur transferase [Burkholderiaceae bacterium]
MNAPQIRQLSPTVSVTGQLDPALMQWVAKEGIKSVINNRPDFEGGPDQPTDAQLKSAALAAGLEYRFLPVAPGYQSPEEIDAFARLLQELPQPILAFCRSGARSTRLFVATQSN